MKSRVLGRSFHLARQIDEAGNPEYNLAVLSESVSNSASSDGVNLDVKLISTTLAAFVLCLLPAMLTAQEPALEKLRQDFAVRYIEPEPHVALARYFHEKGNRLQAFLLLESARRGLVPKEQFDAAFERVFLKREPFDNSKEAEAALVKKLAQDPRTAPALVKLADIHISRSEWTKAREYLARAIKLEPDNFTNVAALAEVNSRDGKDAEANQVVQIFLKGHPESREAFSQKLGPLMTNDRPAAKTLLAQAIKKFPEDGSFLFNMAVVLQDEKKIPEAEDHLVRAAALAKDTPHIQAWTGRFFLKIKADEPKAREYYLSAYFLDPHFYDTEHAEGRIWKISLGLATKRYETLKAAGKKPEELLHDADPIVLGQAIDDFKNRGDAKYLKPLIEALGHDDDYVRAKALEQLLAYAPASINGELSALLDDRDLRRRGMAASLAVKNRGKQGIAKIKPWLNDNAQFIRFGAVIALYQFGGEKGRKLIQEHASREKSPVFKQWLEAALKAGRERTPPE